MKRVYAIVMTMMMWWWLVLAEDSNDATTKLEKMPTYRANSFQVIEKVETKVLTDTYDELSKWKAHQFWETYNQKAGGLTTAQQVATGVMNWDTIIAYAAQMIERLSNLWLVAWSIMILYSWYQYAMTAFGVKDDGGKAIKNAFIGVAVIATSYGIFRLLVRIFIE